MTQGPRSQPSPTPRPRRRTVRDARALAFLVAFLAALWAIFSGKFDAIHLGYGVVSIVLVTLMCRGLLVGPEDRPENEVFLRMNWIRALAYPWWLLWQILLANLQVASLIVHPRMPIEPSLLRFRSGLQSDLALLTLGNSITLTPGTLTLRVDGDVFLVHALHGNLASGLLDGSMQRQVAAVYGEPQLSLEEMQIEVIEDVEAWLEEQP
jgi:multicomponent Na+:H+ antiporter subunit E